ncbi:uncharacterized protein LOC106650621 isoform X1 [Trichogramma pretiosum]|uniref:uncharacterized protein LOC106650621 isoform X1 n=1 Tax=Trichogramma pretiosum TaxID=7493 RepID=UPI0006C94E01|nr:uncharacterized protein LOC106650621 isoform X1 [Trichogramma pretiosum]XP_023317348.1 uncharacterized protein LOC106650621 isoform X1 [Trichogramma pretiosum]
MRVETHLERLGDKKQTVIISKPFFHVGRMKENDLVCLSLLVSRRHCTFTNLPDALYVTDLGSSNGVYINGSQVKPYNETQLKENDIVSIGCELSNDLRNDMFIYRIIKRIVMKASEISESDSCELKSINKKRSRLNTTFEYEKPAKVSKIESNASISCINLDDDDDILMVSHTKDNEIPKLNSVQKNNHETKSIINSEKSNLQNVNPTKKINGMKSNNVTIISREKVDTPSSDHSSNKQIKEPPKIIESIILNKKDKNYLMNKRKTLLSSNRNSSGLNHEKTDPEKEKNKSKSEFKKPSLPVQMKSEEIKNPVLNGEVICSNQIIKSEIMDYNEDENQQKETFNVNDSKTAQSNIDADCTKTIDSNSDTSSKTIANSSIKTNSGITNHSNIKTTNIETTTIDHSNIKVEPDNAETPMNIKQEIYWGTFSQEDVVEINDDDDGFFPSSQLFDRSIVKQENEKEAEADNPPPQTSYYDDDEDENCITILDSSDSECGEQLQVRIESHGIPGMEDITDMCHGSTTGVPNNCRDNLSANNTSTPFEVDHSNISILEQFSPVSFSEVDDLDKLENSSKYGKTYSNAHTHFACLNKIDTSSNAQLINSSVLKDVDPSVQQLINDLTAANEKLHTEQTIEDKSFKASKNKKRAVEVIEPHHMKPKKSNKKSDKSKKETELKSKTEGALKSRTRKDEERVHSSKDSKKRKDSKTRNSKKTECPSDIKLKQNKKTDKTENYDENNKNAPVLNETKSTPEHQGRPRCKTTIVKVKVSTKTRGDMLCDSMQKLETKARQPKKPETKKPTIGSSSLATYIIPRRQVPIPLVPSEDSTEINHSSITTDRVSQTELTLDVQAPPARDKLDIQGDELQNNCVSSTVLTNTSNNINHEPVSSDTNNCGSTSPISEPSESTITTKTKKIVSFKENIADVREFSIIEGNNLRNIKDGKSLRSTKKIIKIPKVLHLKIEDFLARIFSWEPVWLEQQQTVKTSPPPIIDFTQLENLPNTFLSFDHYYKKMESLLLLETWQQLTKEYECTGTRFVTSTAVFCQISRGDIRQMQTPNGLRYTEINVQALVTKQELMQQTLPLYGDMIILEFSTAQNSSRNTKFKRLFGYVTEVQQQNPAKYSRINEKLSRYCKKPDFHMTYVVQTRLIDQNAIQMDQISRIRSILYLRPHLRLIQGLQYVPHSALQDLILNVEIDEFQLATVTTEQIRHYDLMTKEKLNDKQTEAVIKFTNSSINKEPKICLLVGPPGTGKSKVISNLVMQILYGDGRYVNGKPLRILLCAPSNAAVDELVLRLLNIRQRIGEHKFRMVRIGRAEVMHTEVKKISITELAKKDVQNTTNQGRQKNLEEVEKKKHQLSEKIEALEKLIQGDLRNQIYLKDLKKFQGELDRLCRKNPNKEAVEMSKALQMSKVRILKGADIIACTLSSCYSGLMETLFGGNSPDKIATCIVDEATQSCEAENLIPLMLGVKSLILVGDPNQLPATVMSTEAKKLGLDRSLFTRTKEALEPQVKDDNPNYKNPVIMLNLQYRMVSAISHWPNKYFYKGKLENSTNYNQKFPFHAYRVLNIDGFQDDVKFSNTSEAVFIARLIKCLMMYGKHEAWKGKISIGIITPYQNQKKLINTKIDNTIRGVEDNTKNKFEIECNTIDSFQGQERDLIIMSCVRSSGIGFMSDHQRLCVALTRAKHSLIICGNFTTFERDPMWKDLLYDAKGRGVFMRLNVNADPSKIRPHVVRI